MSSTPPAMLSRHTLVSTAAIAVHLVIGIALVVVAANRASITLPVTLSLPVGSPGVFAVVDLAAAAAVIVFVSVVARVAARVLESRGAALSSVRALRYLELSQIAGISLFLIAQLNGIAEAGALVLCYAVGSAAVGVLWVQGRGPAELRSAAWPYSLGAALAIVPWGVVALHQLIGVVAGAPPAPIVRIITIVVLVLAAATWFVERRWQLSIVTDARTDALHTVVAAANGLAFLVLTVGLARPSALF